MNLKTVLTLLVIYLCFSAVYGQQVVLIERGDLLRINTEGIDEYNFLKSVDDNGFLILPYIGKIKAEGLSAEKLSDVIKNKLEDGYFRNPVIRVEIEKSALKKVYVFGLVRNAGEFEYRKNLRVLEVLSMAGGYLGNVDGLSVKIFRQNKRVGTFPLSNLIVNNLINYNVEIMPEDVVIIISEVENEI